MKMKAGSYHTDTDRVRNETNLRKKRPAGYQRLSLSPPHSPLAAEQRDVYWGIYKQERRVQEKVRAVHALAMAQEYKIQEICIFGYRGNTP